MLPTNLSSILAVIAVAATVSANAYPKLVGCVDVLDIKTGIVTDCVPISQLPNGQESNQTRHRGQHVRRRAANENNLCVNLKFNTQSPSANGPAQNRCVSLPTLRQLQTDYQHQYALKPRGDDDDTDASNEPCLDVYYLSPKDNTTMTGSCIPISDLDKYQTVTINPSSDPPSDSSPNEDDPYAIPHSSSLSNRDFGPGVNYTFCTEPYDVIPHLQRESPHFLDCVMIPANALGRSRYFTYRASITDSYTLLAAKTCELAVRTRGTVVNKGTVLKIGNTDIERSYLHGIKAINDLPAGAPGKQELWMAQGFEMEGKWKCWNNAETERYQVYFGYKLKGSQPGWWDGMGNR
ncbi:hypothetical protein QR685DRAFT_562346 [Neurospora intermedia]|uniref:Ecp2 effector protein-like domain-containing protein n=1 Tax=Neurospora intermedia TaxID=5142 RepID=A0ABR3DBV6_NEUIN